MSNFVVNGTIQYPLTPSAQNASASISQTIPFTQRHDDMLVYASTVTNQALVFGTITNPKAVYIEVLSGACTLKLASGDTTTIALGLGATPAATDRSCLLLSNPAGLGALPMVVSVAQSCSLLVFAVQ